MKTYTDIDQSKKLAGILPIESADMIHYRIHLGLDQNYHLSRDYTEEDIISIEKDMITKVFDDVTNSDIECQLPCWSLASLLRVLPTYLFEFDRGIDLNVYPNLNGRGWHCSYMPNCIENMKTDKFKLITSGDTLVDACVAMIERLHEQKLL